MTAQQYTCALCNQVFEYKDGAEESARAEADKNGLELECCDIVCSRCYQQTIYGMPAASQAIN